MQIEIIINVSFYLSNSPGLRKRGKQGFFIFFSRTQNYLKIFMRGRLAKYFKFLKYIFLLTQQIQFMNSLLKK